MSLSFQALLPKQRKLFLVKIRQASLEYWKIELRVSNAPGSYKWARVLCVLFAPSCRWSVFYITDHSVSICAFGSPRSVHFRVLCRKSWVYKTAKGHSLSLQEHHHLTGDDMVWRSLFLATNSRNVLLAIEILCLVLSLRTSSISYILNFCSLPTFFSCCSSSSSLFSVTLKSAWLNFTATIFHSSFRYFCKPDADPFPILCTRDWHSRCSI